MIILTVSSIPSFYSVPSFIIDVWPILLKSMLFSMFLFLCWYFVYVYLEQKYWLEQNKGLIVKYKELQVLLKDFGKQVSCCKKCHERDMQLWNYKKQLLVVRCRSCKMNYTYAKAQNKVLLQVLFHMKSVSILLNKLISYRHHAFGRLLSSQLEIDITRINDATTPLQIMYFKAEKEYMAHPESVREIFVESEEVIYPLKSQRVAV